MVNTATGARYSATSDAEGRFSIDLLPPGDYSARACKFRDYNRQNYLFQQFHGNLPK